MRGPSRAWALACLLAGAACDTVEPGPATSVLDTLDPARDRVFIVFNGRPSPPGPMERVPASVPEWTEQLRIRSDAMSAGPQRRQLELALAAIDRCLALGLDVLVIERWQQLPVPTSVLRGPRERKPALILYCFDPGPAAAGIEDRYERVMALEGIPNPDVRSAVFDGEQIRPLNPGAASRS